MQKKIIVLAIAAALTTPALAMAEANVYGLVDLSVDMANDGASSNSTSTNQLVSNASRLGVKGSEDLGGGNTFVWQMESTVGMDNGTAGTAPTAKTTTVGVGTTAVTTVSGINAGHFFDRDTFIGLANANMGTLILGQHDTPYKMSTRNLDVFADSAADNRKMMGQGVADARLSNVIAYVSPNMNGLSVVGATMFGAETAANGDKKGTAISLAGMYSQGPIYATLAYQTVKFGTAGSGDLGAGLVVSNIGLTTSVDDKLTTFKLGGSYKMDQFTVNAVYENVTYTAGTGGDAKGSNLYLSGKFNVSSTDAVKLAYTSKGVLKVTGGDLADKASQIALGYDHDMTKATTVYALYTKTTNDVGGAYGGASAAGSDPSVLSVGIKHSF